MKTKCIAATFLIALLYSAPITCDAHAPGYIAASYPMAVTP